jgi:hypothetical protein
MVHEHDDHEIAVTVPATKTTLLVGIVIALVLLAIGAPTESEWLLSIGAAVLALALFWGGLFFTREHVALRVALVVIAGLVAVNAFLGSIAFSLFG